MKGLTFSSSMSFSTTNLSNEFFLPIAASDPVDNPTGTANFGNTRNSTLAIEPQLGYDRTIAQGKLSVQLGGTAQKTSTRGNTLNAYGYTNDDLLKSAGNASYYNNRDELSDYKYAGIFGRINYNWANKYIINFNARRDGSSRFAPGRQFGNFGSAGAAWNASEEEWLQPLLPSWLSFVKLRGSYAVTGSDAVGDYAYLARFSGAGPGSSRALFQYDGIAPFIPVVPVNQQYRWEALKSIDVSMNLGFLNDRINFDLTWYRKNVIQSTHKTTYHRFTRGSIR